MKHETKFGTISIVPKENGFKVVSDIPFKKINKFFPKEKYDDAVSFFNSLKKEVDDVINEIEKTRKTITTSKSYIFNKLLKMINSDFRKILLYGPTGTGKTFTAIEVLKKLKSENKISDFIIFTFSSGMEDIDLLGKFIPDEKKTLKFSESELLKFMKENRDKKIAVVFDEFNRANSKTLNILIPLLDGRNGQVVVNNYVNNETITLPENNVVFIFTANFGAGYSGTFQLDDAILNRVELAIFCDYQETIEDMILEELPKEKRDIAKKIREFFREAYKQGLCNPFTTRDLKVLVKLLFRADMTVNSIYSELLPILHKIVKIDPQGYPDTEFLEDFKNFLKKELEGDEDA